MFENLHTTYTVDGETCIATAKQFDTSGRFIGVWTLVYTADGFEVIVHPNGRHTRPGDEHESSPASRFYAYVGNAGM